MNVAQKIVVIVGIIVIIALLLFPPFEFYNGAMTFSLGYAFILTPPKIGSYKWTLASVNVPLLLSQWIGVSGALALVWVLLRGQGRKALAAASLQIEGMKKTHRDCKPEAKPTLPAVNLGLNTAPLPGEDIVDAIDRERGRRPRFGLRYASAARPRAHMSDLELRKWNRREWIKTLLWSMGFVYGALFVVFGILTLLTATNII